MHIPLAHRVPGATTRSSCCTSAGHIAEAETETKIPAAPLATRKCQTPHVARLGVTRPMPAELHCSDPGGRVFTARTSPQAAREAYRMLQLRAAIATRLERGDTVDTVERELIARSELREEQRHALWLYAWSHTNRPAAGAPKLSVWAALGNALLVFVGIYRH